MLQKLPVGIQTFAKIIEGNYVYVDKTEYIYKLIQNGGYYFLSRPRRFGKSLLLSTIESVFLQKEHLFKDLWIAKSDYNWQEFPVIRIDLSEINSENLTNIREGLKQQIRNNAYKYQISLSAENNGSEMFAELIKKLAQKNSVVILIDEYDKPIINNLLKPEVATIRDILRDFYAVIKANDEYTKFVMLTGVTRFSKVSIFSGLNNLEDISLNDEYAAMLGYTQTELENYFALHLKDLAEYRAEELKVTLAEIKKWYNGYLFAELDNKVYNPFSCLLLFKQNKFLNHWFATGTPSFLINLLKESPNISLADLDDQEVSYEDFASFDIDNLNITAIMQQTGYLTIKKCEYKFAKLIYTLGYPNYEVKRALIEAVFKNFSHLPTSQDNHLQKLAQNLLANNFSEYFENLQIFFADIPYNIRVGNKEKYFQTIFYTIHKLLGYHINAEVTTNIGRIDSVIEFSDRVFIFEFKLNGSKEEAIIQIKKQKYYEKYLTKKVTIIGVEFSLDYHNISGFIVEDIN